MHIIIYVYDFVLFDNGLHGFLSCRKKIFTEASATFQDAISKEMNTRLGSIPIKTNRGALLLSDSISYEEKERWCDQDYLSLNDPNRFSWIAFSRQTCRFRYGNTNSGAL